MAQPSSPSQPHRSDEHPNLHVDLRGPDEKIHADVHDYLGAIAISGYMRDQERQAKGRQ